MPEALPDWDYHTELHLRRTLEVDVERVRRETGISPEAELAVAAVWTSTGSNLSGPGARASVPGGGRVPLELRLRGTDLGGLLVLDTALVLAGRATDGRPAAPWRAGSVLWSERDTLRLQGDAAQFPMAVIDFERTSFPADAGWHLQIGGGLHHATMGNLLLLVNERNRTLREAFENAASPRPPDRAVLDAVHADIARSMLESALRDEEFTDEADFDEETLGATFLALFERLFPEQTIADVRLRLEQSPALFATDLQHAVRIFEGTTP
ncbi:hypothetical protein [Streptomyces sp. TR06-5]|uniref:hypothetical protein n=1 Tax=Streptomyces sp. TR06-5 TaxID=3385976 RepID=UPI0039A247BA